MAATKGEVHVSAFHRLVRGSLVVLIAGLAACGGGGGGGGGSTPGPVTPPSKIFVGDAFNAAIGSSPNSNPSAGTSVVDRIIQGSNTRLSTNMWDFAIDATNDRLFVSDQRSIIVFDNVSTASGNVTSRVLSSFDGAGALGNYVGIALDTTNNRIYAAGNGIGGNINNFQIDVFNNASSASSIPPSRTFTFPITTSGLFDVAIDPAKNILYVYRFASFGGTTEIAVFDGASALTGPNVTPNRTISVNESFSTPNLPVGMLFLDVANDRLYAAHQGGVYVFDGASAKSGSVATLGVVSRSIDFTPTLGFVLSAVTVDLAANRLYAADNAGLNIIQNASTANGNPAPFVRVLAPGSSRFQAVAVKP